MPSPARRSSTTVGPLGLTHVGISTVPFLTFKPPYTCSWHARSSIQGSLTEGGELAMFESLSRTINRLRVTHLLAQILWKGVMATQSSTTASLINIAWNIVLRITTRNGSHDHLPIRNSIRKITLHTVLISQHGGQWRTSYIENLLTWWLRRTRFDFWARVAYYTKAVSAMRVTGTQGWLQLRKHCDFTIIMALIHWQWHLRTVLALNQIGNSMKGL